MLKILRNHTKEELCELIPTTLKRGKKITKNGIEKESVGISRRTLKSYAQAVAKNTDDKEVKHFIKTWDDKKLITPKICITILKYLGIDVEEKTI